MKLGGNMKTLSKTILLILPLSFIGINEVMGASEDDLTIQNLSGTFEVNSNGERTLSLWWTIDAVSLPRVCISVQYGADAIIKLVEGKTTTAFSQSEFPSFAEITEAKGDIRVEAISCTEDGTTFPSILHITPNLDESVSATASTEPQEFFRTNLIRSDLYPNIKEIEEEITQAEEALRCPSFPVSDDDVRGCLLQLIPYSSRLAETISVLKQSTRVTLPIFPTDNIIFVGDGQNFIFDNKTPIDIASQIIQFIADSQIKTCENNDNTCISNLGDNTIIGFSNDYIDISKVSATGAAIILSTGRNFGFNPNTTPSQTISKELLDTGRVLLIGGFDSLTCAVTLNEARENKEYCVFEPSIAAHGCGEATKEHCVLLPALATFHTERGTTTDLEFTFVRIAKSLALSKLLRDAYDLSAVETIALLKACAEDIHTEGPDAETGLGVVNLDCLFQEDVKKNLLGFVQNPLSFITQN